jgi:hypothetical protein
MILHIFSNVISLHFDKVLLHYKRFKHSLQLFIIFILSETVLLILCRTVHRVTESVNSFIILKMKAESVFKSPGTNNQTTRRNPEHLIPRRSRDGDLKSLYLYCKGYIYL